MIPVTTDFGGTGEGIIQVLSAAPQIEDLGLIMWPNKHFRISTEREMAHDVAGHQLSRGYHWAAFSQVVKVVSFAQVTRSRLGSIRTTAGLLNKFLSSSAPTLQDIRLAYVKLALGLENTNREQPQAPWRIVFSTLAKGFPRLSDIHFRCIDVELPCCYVTSDTDSANDDECGWDDDLSHQDFFKAQLCSKPIFPSFVLEAQGLAEVHRRLRVITKKHWFTQPERHELEQGERVPLWPGTDDKT